MYPIVPILVYGLSEDGDADHSFESILDTSDEEIIR